MNRPRNVRRHLRVNFNDKRQDANVRTNGTPNVVFLRPVTVGPRRLPNFMSISKLKNVSVTKGGLRWADLRNKTNNTMNTNFNITNIRVITQGIYRRVKINRSMTFRLRRPRTLNRVTRVTGGLPRQINFTRSGLRHRQLHLRTISTRNRRRVPHRVCLTRSINTMNKRVSRIDTTSVRVRTHRRLPRLNFKSNNTRGFIRGTNEGKCETANRIKKSLLTDKNDGNSNLRLNPNIWGIINRGINNFRRHLNRGTHRISRRITNINEGFTCPNNISGKQRKRGLTLNVLRSKRYIITKRNTAVRLTDKIVNRSLLDHRNLKHIRKPGTGLINKLNTMNRVTLSLIRIMSPGNGFFTLTTGNLNRLLLGLSRRL